MTALRAHGPLTSAEFLIESTEDLGGELAQALTAEEIIDKVGTLPRLSAPAGRLACRWLADTVVDLLAGIRIEDVLRVGWQKYAALANAAERTRRSPGSEELVDLAAHRIHSVHQPQVDVLVDGARVGEVRFRLDLEVLVRALVATVRHGRLATVESGRCRLSARLSCFDITLCAHERELDVGAVLDLGAEGMPLRV